LDGRARAARRAVARQGQPGLAGQHGAAPALAYHPALARGPALSRRDLGRAARRRPSRHAAPGPGQAGRVPAAAHPGAVGPGTRLADTCMAAPSADNTLRESVLAHAARVPASWQPALQAAQADLARVAAFVDERLAAGAIIYPKHPFKALEYAAPAEVRVV